MDEPDQPLQRLRGMPDDTPDYMAPAWLGCLHWAAGQAEIITRFEKDTGFKWTPARTGLERAIDEACGMPDKFCAAFIPWVNENIWGSLDATVSDEVEQADG